MTGPADSAGLLQRIANRLIRKSPVETVAADVRAHLAVAAPTPVRGHALRLPAGNASLSLLIAACITFSSVAAQAQYSRADSTRWGTRAMTFLGYMIGGDYTAAAAMASPLLPAGALTPSTLQQGWQQIGGLAGAHRGHAMRQITSTDGIHTVDFTGAFERATFTIRVVLDDSARVQGFGVLPMPQETTSVPPAYADTSSFTERHITFGKPEWQVEGTLSLPRGGGPFPVVVLVHGSGPNDRDETLGANKPFRDIAMGLASRGIAVFRYDKRTFVHSQRMTAAQVTLEDEVIDDALLAVELMRRTAGVDSSRVFVLGHSLGGMLLPEIAQRDGRLAGVILAAAPARPLSALLAEQLTYIDSLTRAAGDTANIPLRTLRAQVDSVRARTSGAATMVMGVPASYWYTLDSLDAVGTLQKLSMPVLVLQGGRDYQVTTTDFDLWQRAITAPSRATFRLYPNLNHLFLAGSGKATPAEYASLRAHVAEEVVLDMARWIGGGGRD